MDIMSILNPVGDKFGFKSLSYDPNKPKNRVDYLKWMTDKDLHQYLDVRRHNYSLLLMNLKNDNNVGNIIRSSNAFLAKEVIIYGHKHIDRNPCVGAEFFCHFRHIKFIEDLQELSTEYNEIVGLENNRESHDLKNFEWDKKKNTLIIVGHEGDGIPDEALAICHKFVEIRQFGTVRSLNVSVASGIIMNDYCNKTGEIE